MSSNLSRRQFVRAGLLGASALGTLGLAACSGDGAGSSDAGQASSDGTIELKYWYSWTDKIKENNEERVKEFNETVGKEKGIHVTAEYQAPTTTSTPSSRLPSPPTRSPTSASWSSTAPRPLRTAA